MGITKYSAVRVMTYTSCLKKRKIKQKIGYLSHYWCALFALNKLIYFTETISTPKIEAYSNIGTCYLRCGGWKYLYWDYQLKWVHFRYHYICNLKFNLYDMRMQHEENYLSQTLLLYIQECFTDWMVWNRIT